MSTLFSMKGKTRDGVKIELTAYDKNKPDVKGVPAKIKIGIDPSIPCTLYFNTTASGAVIAELRGPIPRVDDNGKPILKIVDNREMYDFVSYTNKETNRTVWAEAPLGSFSVQEGRESKNKYIMGKMYLSHTHLEMARLLYAIRHPTENDPKQDSIDALNKIQSDRSNTYLVNIFPSQDSYSALNASKLFATELASSTSPRPQQSSSPSPA
ncbi:MAG: hypothetical protein RSD49_01565 [Hafnia sp.]